SVELGDEELRALLSDDHLAHQGDVEAAADGVSVDGRDHRLPVAETLEGLLDVGPAALRAAQLGQLLLGAHLALLDVGAPAEGGPLATDDPDHRPGVLVELEDHVAEPSEEVVVERVEDLGAVERDVADPVTLLVGHDWGSHWTSRWLGVRDSARPRRLP